jgi:1,2-diacylglycerol 3-alpha-glucosyltransferase
VVFFTRHHDHNFLEVIKVTINPYNLARKLSKNDVIVTIVPNGNDILTVPLLSKRTNSKLRLILDFHGITPVQYHKSLRRRLIEFYRLMTTKLLNERSDSVVVHSNYMRQELLRRFQAKSVVVPWGVDTGKFNTHVDGSGVRKKFRLESDFVLLYVGRLVPHKRVSLLIEALSELKDKNAKLLVVGDGPERERLEEYARTHNLGDSIIFTGYVSDVDLPKYYRACDVFVTASLHEGVCVPILEAFACGKPAIAPNISAMPETLSDGGLIYQENSLDSLVDKIKLLRDNTDLRYELGRKGLRIASQRDSERCGVEYRLFLERIGS